MDILSIKNLNKRFGDKQVLCGVDLNVPQNSIFGFVGRNGAGKTTTMKAVLGLLKCDEGEICVMGEKVLYGQTKTNKHIGYLPDVPEFYSFMNAMEYLELCGQGLEMKSSEIKERSRELLSLVGLAGEKHRIKGYSRGMKQRLGIASALLGSPELLICDEPTSALDPIGRKEILDILVSVKSQTTVLFSTHILSDVERICTDVALLDGGKIVMQGTVSELKSKKRREEFAVELADEKWASILANSFSLSSIKDESTVVFEGDDSKMYEVMDYISECKIPIKRIERQETSLENLFVEVISG